MGVERGGGPGAAGGGRATTVAVALALACPVVGLAVLLAVPSTDVRWEHHPSHFWLVLAAALVAGVLGWSVGDAARRRYDARLFLVSLAFVAAASFLGLHALATPKVLLDGPNAGFVLATPVGLLVAAAFAAWSSLPLDGERARWVMAHTRPLRAGLLVAVAGWAAWSLARLPGLDGPPPARGAPVLVVSGLVGVVLFAVAAWRYAGLAHRRASALLWAVASAWVLLAESMAAVALARSWQASWWEWHVLVLIAFAVVAWAARRLPDGERFADLYLEGTAAGLREVSVLFADLAGFTAFSEHTPASGVQAMLNEAFAAVLPAVRAEGGRVDKFIGDAVMVTFNAAGDQPDHAGRAARAALAFQRAGAALAETHPDWPRFRVGVNSGEAAVGVVGDAAERGWTVLGDVVNVASRIEGLAPPGAVAIGGATLRLLPGARVATLGEVAVKGRSAPVEVWRLDAVAAPTAT